MKIKSKAILSAVAAAALTAGIVFNASASTTDAQSEELSYVTEDASYDGLTEFEEALLRGESPHDPNCLQCGKPNGHPKPVDNGKSYQVITNPPAQTNGDVTLTLIHGDVEDGEKTYTLWGGRFTCDDIKAFTANFTSPDTFTCRVYEELFPASGKSAPAGSITGKNNYLGNYKEAHTELTYLDSSGKRIVKSKISKGTNKTISAYCDSCDETLVEVKYFFYMRNGTGSGSELLEVAMVHIVDKTYSASAAYAENSYADMIDQYTFIDTDMLSENVPSYNSVN